MMSRLDSFRARLTRMAGWRRYGAALLAGALFSLTMAPFGLFPLAFLCVPAFVWMAQASASKKSAFLLGWSFGAGYFIAGLYWISAALFVDIGMWGWVLPLSLVVGPALLALATWAFVPLLAWRWRGHAAAYPLVFVTAWALVEWLRGHLFTGFPWNLPGYMWQHLLPVMQTASLVGVYGLTLLTLFWAALPAYARHRPLRLAAAGLFALCLTYGGARLALNPTAPNGGHTVRIVQPNLSQSMKWDGEQQWKNLELQAQMSESADPASFVIWPETAVSADLVLFPEIARYISQKLPRDGIGILGALRVTLPEGRETFHNGVYLLDSRAQVQGSYDKFHLVPFGEYIPFRSVLNITPIAAAVSSIGDFSAGTGNRTLSAGGLPPFSPLICYEVIFPRAVVDRADRPQWMVNLTNDGWYGRSSGPYQHFEITRMRTIEEGLPLARAANTGISAMIDPLGRVVARQPLGTRGTLSAILPAPLPPTVYARFGDLGFYLMAAGLLAAAMAMSRRKKPLT